MKTKIVLVVLTVVMTVTLAYTYMQEAQMGRALCMKADNKTIGICVSQVFGGGHCACQ
jgi:hypothetical protein